MKSQLGQRGENTEQFIQEFKQDMADFRKKTAQFYAKELGVKEYKGLSGEFGSYAQRGAEASMLRLRLPGGRLTKEKLGFIADMIEKHEVNLVHFTTCQTIQLHNLNQEAVCDIMEKAMEVGIITRGGGGDFPRNVMASPLSGVEEGEFFDVLPYAEQASDYLLKQMKTVKMPRKLKVCFSNSPANITHATFRDLGFAAREDGTFDVYSAGGLGNNPKMGVRVAEAVPPTEVLYYVQAMIDTFVTYGNYENRMRARTRFMQDVCGGPEGYRAAYLEKLAAIKERGGLNIQLQERPVQKTGDGSAVEDARVIRQKQEGLYAVAYHPIGGSPAVGKFREIFETIRDMDEVELRIAPGQTVYFINLTGTEAKQVLAVTEDGARNIFETSVACIGSEICQIGLRNSQRLLKAIVNAVAPYNFADGVLPRIHISGCTSSCGTHQIGALGFHGGAKKIDGVTEPAFTFHVNGCDHQGQERFGEKWGVMLERQIPEFFVELGSRIQKSGMKYDQWYREEPERLRNVAEKYFI